MNICMILHTFPIRFLFHSNSCFGSCIRNLYVSIRIRHRTTTIFLSSKTILDIQMNYFKTNCGWSEYLTQCQRRGINPSFLFNNTVTIHTFYTSLPRWELTIFFFVNYAWISIGQLDFLTETLFLYHINNITLGNS